MSKYWIESESLRAEVDPQGGAYLRELHIKKNGEWQEVFQSGKSLFVMGPYPNRVPGGSFPWKDGVFDLKHPEDPENAIHGVFRYVAWDVVEQSESSSLLSMDSEKCAERFTYPSSYKASIRYGLDKLTLSVRLDFENAGEEDLPFGTGPHMYGLRYALGSKGPLLKHRAKTWFPPESEGAMPSDSGSALPEERRYSENTLWSTDWDHCVSDWEQSSEISWPDVGLSLHVRDVLGNCPYLQIWNTPAQDICAVEPQTMVPSKLGDSETQQRLGCLTLAPGERFSAEWEFRFVLS